jgi:UV excision repair protein RAD23
VPPAFLQQQQTGGSGPFDFLRQHPQFNMLRQMVQQNPQLLQPVLQQLGQQNPQILQLINQHQQEFIQLLNEPVQPGAATYVSCPLVFLLLIVR